MVFALIVVAYLGFSLARRLAGAVSSQASRRSSRTVLTSRTEPAPVQVEKLHDPSMQWTALDDQQLYRLLDQAAD